MSNGIPWPGAASDPGNVLDSPALGALLDGDGTAAGFSIGYERVPQAIADLEEAARLFRSQTQLAQAPANIPASGIDRVDTPSCDIDVRPAQRQSVMVIYASKELRNDPQQSCMEDKQVAAAVLKNLPPRS